MMRRKNSGFTIIEVMLFLAISGVMAVGLMVGTGMALRGQQYRDSVQSYANFIRDQYSKVITVVNDRSSDDDCSLVGGSTDRGRSECVVVGRYLSTGENDPDAGVPGEAYRVRPIYAIETGADTWRYGLGDKDAEYTTNWAVKTRVIGTTGNIRMGIAMWRDPQHGMLRVAASPSLVSDIDNFISTNTAITSGGDREICVFGDGFIASQNQSVFIDAKAGSSDAVRVGVSSGGCQL